MPYGPLRLTACVRDGRLETLAIWGEGAPGLGETGQIAAALRGARPDDPAEVTRRLARLNGALKVSSDWLAEAVARLAADPRD